MEGRSFAKRVCDAVKLIPEGKVATYRAVARCAGNPRAARAAGNTLHRNPFRTVPCHRVVRSDGSVGGFARGSGVKAALLKEEGIAIHRKKVAPEYILYHLDAHAASH